MTYNLRVKNLGPNTAQGVVLTDQLAGRYSFQGWVGGVTPSGCNTPLIGQYIPKIMCSRTTLTSGSSFTVSFMAKVGIRTQNSASVKSLNFDPNLSNNTGIEKATLP